MSEASKEELVSICEAIMEREREDLLGKRATCPQDKIFIRRYFLKRGERKGVEIDLEDKMLPIQEDIDAVLEQGPFDYAVTVRIAPDLYTLSNILLSRAEIEELGTAETPWALEVYGASIDQTLVLQTSIQIDNNSSTCPAVGFGETVDCSEIAKNLGFTGMLD